MISTSFPLLLELKFIAMDVTSTSSQYILIPFPLIFSNVAAVPGYLHVGGASSYETDSHIGGKHLTWVTTTNL